MQIYQFRTSLTVSGGSASTLSLNVIHGLCRQVIVEAATDTTTFFANIVDENSLNVMDYGMQTWKMNDVTSFPMKGVYTFSITNASQTDTFKCYFGVEE